MDEVIKVAELNLKITLNAIRKTEGFMYVRNLIDLLYSVNCGLANVLPSYSSSLSLASPQQHQEAVHHRLGPRGGKDPQ